MALCARTGAFRALDGLINIAANKQEQFEALANAIGRADLVLDERFARREDRKRHRSALSLELEATLQTKTCAEWVELFTTIGVPAGCVLTVPQALELPQIRQRELLKTFESAPGVEGPLTVTRAGFKLSDGEPDVVTPPPELGEHTTSVLGSIGYSTAEIAGLREAGAI